MKKTILLNTKWRKRYGLLKRNTLYFYINQNMY